MAHRQWDGSANTVYTNTANWAGGVAPADTDHVHVDWMSALTGVNNIAGGSGAGYADIELSSFRQYQISPITIGTQATPLTLDTALFEFGIPASDGSQGGGCPSGVFTFSNAVACVYNIYNTGTSSDSGLPALRFKVTGASDIANIFGGTVGIAINDPADTAQLLTINALGGTVDCGSGLTYGTLNIDGGGVIVRSAPTTAIIIASGGLTTFGDYLIPELQVKTLVTLNHARTAAGNEITTLDLYEGAVIDLRQNPNSFKVGAINLYGNARILRFNADSDLFDINSATVTTFLGGILHLE